MNFRLLFVLTTSIVSATLFFTILPQSASAATFTMQSGYYAGNGTDNRAITGIGFQPNLVIIKDDTTAGAEGAIFKTTSMASELSLTISETDANLTTNHIQSLDSDGFTIGNDTDVNSSNVGYYWTAFGGSDCSASGTFCVGSYTGNGTSQAITSVGFQPDLVVTKRSGASEGVWKSSAMSGTNTNYFHNANQLASGGISSLDATGFTVGNNIGVNTSANTYYFFAFKQVSGAMDVGTYTGNATDNRNLTSTDDAGLTFQPNMLWVKNASAATAQVAVFNNRESYGDRSRLFTDSASAANNIQELRSAGGFQVGTTANVNSSAVVYYYAAFGGAPARSAGSGTFYATSGTYTGTGTGFSIASLGFAPDLVIIKDNAAQQSVFKTRNMVGDRTAYVTNALTHFTGGITALGNDGFTIGTGAMVNTASNTYMWQAFGNAMRPDASGGSSDFYIGQYIGTGLDNQNITGLPIDSDMVTIKGATSQAGVWRTDDQSGDNTLFFSATAQAANLIQALNADGFQVGTAANVNSSAVTYDYFAFKNSDRFITNTYTGTGATQNITTVGAQPDYLWLKKTTGGTARQGVLRTSTQTGDAAQPFVAATVITGVITNLRANGFALGTGTEGNENTFAYQYAAWDAKEYTQQVYRLFANNDSTDVGAPLASVNTPATLSSTNEAFRLRMLLRVDDGNQYSNSQDFTLQFAEKSGTCDTAFTGETYANVTSSTLIAYNNNATPADGAALTANANDPVDAGRTIINQTYVEQNPFANVQSAITKGQDGKWDFALIDNGAPAETSYCFRVQKSGGIGLDTYTVIPEITTAASTSSTLRVDIVDAGGTTVGSPSVIMSNAVLSLLPQTVTGTLGVSSQRIRVTNTTASAPWTLSIAATGGAGAFWDGTTNDYDFNDPTVGTTDGPDTDTLAGQLTVNPSVATISPEAGCSNTNISLGSQTAFSEGVANAVTLATAIAGANTDCYWDITGIGLSQTIPKERAVENYNLNMTLTIVAN